MDTINELFKEQIQDLYSAENQLIKALPKMANKASTKELKKSFEDHLKQTKGQVLRLKKIADIWNFKPTGKSCKAMQGLIAEGGEVLKDDGDELVIDSALIAAAQRVEHYEISAYGTAKAFATRLGCKQSADLLGQTLREESRADELLSKISTSKILSSAPIDNMSSKNVK